MQFLRVSTSGLHPLISRPTLFALYRPNVRPATSFKKQFAPLVTMALPPKFAAHRMTFGQPVSQDEAVPPTPHTIEIYLDYCVRPQTSSHVSPSHPLPPSLPSPGPNERIQTHTHQCPFSAKIFNTLLTTVAPLIRSNPSWASRAELIFRHQIQPWHPQSTLMHESALAVNQIAPGKFWAYSKELFAHAEEFFDANVVNEARNETYGRLVKVAGKVGVDEGEVLTRLRVSDKPVDGAINVGNGVTADVKTVVKMARLTGVHVSPTVILDGIVAGEVSSSWGEAEWKEWLTKNIA